MRIGHGYDVHRLTEGRKLILGGVDIPHEKGLLGHSDADVLAHAIMDSILGALALGDIGKLFPDNDPDYEGADSMKLMEKVISVMTEKGWKIGNIDSTICAQKPKLATYVTSMRERIAEACGCDISQISVKATTEEKLGFTGEELGISATAVCLLTKILFKTKRTAVLNHSSPFYCYFALCATPSLLMLYPSTVVFMSIIP